MFYFKLKWIRCSTKIFRLSLLAAIVILFLYFFRTQDRLPDISWLSMRNNTVFLRPAERTVIREPSSCSVSSDTSLLVAVFSAPGNTLARTTIRRTWGKRMMEYPGVKLVFMLGQDSVHQKALFLEAEDNNDMIIEDFHDTYLNLTLKTTFLLKWVTASCSRVKYVFKVDDDVFVNPDRLWSSLKTSPFYSLTVLSTSPSNREKEHIPRQVVYSFTGHVMNTSPIR